jgi:hypothetical protein
MGRREGGEERAAHPLRARKARPVPAAGLVSVLGAGLPAACRSTPTRWPVRVLGGCWAGAGAGAGARGRRWLAGTLARGHACHSTPPRLHARAFARRPKKSAAMR